MKKKNIDRSVYMRNYYQNRKLDLQNKSLIRNHKDRLLKEINLKQALEDLLLYNRKRRDNSNLKKNIRKIIISFD